METPICVVDAPALVEHIHEIKRWIHHGHLRLVVPLCTVENVRQLCQKENLEQELKKPASPRQRPVGKPARKEHPAFDINPRVTLEFLERLQVDNVDGLVFQQPTEEYSPWKGVEVQPERKDPKEERPTTFAQAVLLKLNPPNAISETSDATKGPTKAKLVARASATDISPWKMNKNAPKISVGLVPETLRPLLSYTLWLLYESVITRSDGNRSILLTNDVAASDIARKLNITVKSVPEVRQLIISKAMSDIDRNCDGQLEREFGRREPKASSSHCSQDSVLGGSEDDQKNNIEKQADGIILDLTEDGDSTVEDAEVVVPEIKSHISTMEELPSVNEERKIDHGLNAAAADLDAKIVEDQKQASFAKSGHEMNMDTVGYSTLASNPSWRDIVAKPGPDIARKSTPPGSQENKVRAETDMTDKPTAAIERPMIVGNGVPRGALVSSEPEAISARVVQTQNRQYSSQSDGSSDSTPCSPRPSSEANSLSTTEAQDPEDSDEEVVVFNPRAKRWSTQSKLVQEVSPPTLPAKTSNARNPTSSCGSPPRNEASNQAPVTPSTSGPAQGTSPRRPQALNTQTSGAQIPRSQVHRDQAQGDQGPRKGSPRNRSPRTQAQRNQVRQNQTPPNRAPPAVIDPDFFGRSPVVNIHPNSQNGQGRYFQRGSPRRGPRVLEPEVEYVLTSGATREATRGKGKLWVP